VLLASKVSQGETDEIEMVDMTDRASTSSNDRNSSDSMMGTPRRKRIADLPVLNALELRTSTTTGPTQTISIKADEFIADFGFLTKQQ